MTFNLKTKWGLTIRHHVLSLPPGKRNLTTGFWLASEPRVREERLIRIADMPSRRFVLEAEIDPTDTHIMTPDRFEEYVQLELLKRPGSSSMTSIEDVREHVRQRLSKGGVVVAFRNARAYDAELNHTGRSPFSYSED